MLNIFKVSITSLFFYSFAFGAPDQVQLSQEKLDILCVNKKNQVVIDHRDRFLVVNKNTTYRAFEYLDLGILFKTNKDNNKRTHIHMLPLNKALLITGTPISLSESSGCKKIGNVNIEY